MIRRGVGDRQAPLDNVPPVGVVLGQELERLAVEGNRPVLGLSPLGLLRHCDQMLDRPLSFAGIAPVTRESGRSLAGL